MNITLAVMYEIKDFPVWLSAIKNFICEKQFKPEVKKKKMNQNYFTSEQSECKTVMAKNQSCI